MSKKILIIFFLIFILGASLRIYNLGAESLWFDEPYSIIDAKQNNLKEVVASVNLNEWYNPPFYYFLLHYWMKYSGDSEFNLRLFSAFFGILSIVLVFLLAKVLFNPEVGLLSSFIFSLSIVEILYSQEIRAYAFFSFLVLLSTYSFIKIFKENKTSYYLLYFLSSLAMLYTLPFSFIVLFFQNFFILFFHEKYRHLLKKWFFGQFCLFLFFIPEIPTFLKMFKKNYVYNFIILVEKYHAPFIFKNNYFTLFLFGFIFVLSVILIFYFRKRLQSFIENLCFKKYDYLFLFFLVSLSFVYFYLTPLLVRPIFLTRYTLFLMPFIYIAIAAGISKFERPIKLIIILGIILLSFHTLLTYYPETTKEDWRSAAAYVEQNAQEEDLILLCPSSLAFEYYYSGRQEIINAKRCPDTPSLAEKLKGKNYWLVFSPDHKKGELCEELLSPYTPSIHQIYYRVEILYFTS